MKSLFWKIYLKARGAKVGENFKCSGSLAITLKDGASLKNLTIGDDVMFEGKVYIHMRKNGKIVLDDHVRVCTESRLVVANEATLKAGTHTKIGYHSVLNAGADIIIGEYCLIAGYGNINSADHNFRSGEKILLQGYKYGAVTIGDDVWLGIHSVVTMGITIADGAIIGANAVVTKDIEKQAIAVGVPAKKIRTRTA